MFRTRTSYRPGFPKVISRGPLVSTSRTGPASAFPELGTAIPVIRSDHVALPGRLGDVSLAGAVADSVVSLFAGALVCEPSATLRLGARVGVWGADTEALDVAGTAPTLCGVLADAPGCQTAGVGSRAVPTFVLKEREDAVAGVGAATLGAPIAP